MTFLGLFEILFGSAAETAVTIFSFVCVTVFCFIFQVVFLRNTKAKYGVHLSARHFILVYVFLIYLMMVYQVTGIGTIWARGNIANSLMRGQVQLIPFTEFGATDILNIIMTMPLGFLLPMIWTEFRSLKKVALVAAVFSLAIEVSQLFNNRATAMDDLIFNILGAILGYLIFRAVYMGLFRQYTRKSYEQKNRASAHRIKYEAIIYLFCSFLGMVLLFNPMLPLRFVASSVDPTHAVQAYATPDTPTDAPAVHMEPPSIAEHSILGRFVAMSEDSIIVQYMSTEEISPDEEVLGDTEYQKTIRLVDETTFEMWEHDGQRVIRQFEVSRHELLLGDTVDVSGFFEHREFFAERVIISRRVQ